MDDVPLKAIEDAKNANDGATGLKILLQEPGAFKAVDKLLQCNKSLAAVASCSLDDSKQKTLNETSKYVETLVVSHGMKLLRTCAESLTHRTGS